MLNEIQVGSNRGASAGRLRVTVVSKLKNAAMHAAVKQFGSQAKLAKRLGVKPGDVNRWCNLNGCPPKHPRGEWTHERIDKLESDLLEITGLLLDDIFPDSLRENVKFLRYPKSIERTREIESDAMLQWAERHAERIDVQPSILAERSELVGDIAESLKLLPRRERQIVERRFGIGTPGEETYEQIGDSLGISKARVREPEGKAIRRLYRKGERLRKHVDESPKSEQPEDPIELVILKQLISSKA